MKQETFFYWTYWLHKISVKQTTLHTAGDVEYNDCISAEEYPPTKCLSYDMKESDGEVSVMLELWGMRGTLSLP